MPCALVTGASGMVGGRLVERLVRDHVRVRVLLRPGSQYREPAHGSVEVVRDDPYSAAALERAVAGCDTVFHCAGAVSARSPFQTGGDESVYRRGILDLTTALLDRAQRAGVARFIYLSSVAVYASEARSPIAEDAPVAPSSVYGRFKLLAESEVRRQRGMPATIVRPCIIYGPGDRHFVPALRTLGAIPLLPLPEGGRSRMDLVHVEDVVSLLTRAAVTPAAAGHVYNAASGHPVSLRTIVHIVRSARGTVTPLVVAVPGRLAIRGSVLARWYLRLVAPSLLFAATESSVTRFMRDTYFDVAKAARDLNYQPRYRVEEALPPCLTPHALFPASRVDLPRTDQ
ncbi:MAG: NAD-dependent epimerase/dehydratase family protein [Vicinamibacterales bacterium]